jgi:hypothetical protein
MHRTQISGKIIPFPPISDRLLLNKFDYFDSEIGEIAMKMATEVSQPIHLSLSLQRESSISASEAKCISTPSATLIVVASKSL